MNTHQYTETCDCHLLTTRQTVDALSLSRIEIMLS